MKIGFSILPLLCLSLSVSASDPRCPAADAPPPPVLKADLSRLTSLLEKLQDTQGRGLWKTTPETAEALRETFEAVPQRTKLEQFFRLLMIIQKNIDPKLLPLRAEPLLITEILLAAKVFTEPSFPRKITAVELKTSGSGRPSLFKVSFSEKEVRFPINGGRGFASWDQGMCQIAKDLVFYPGFSFRVRKANNSKNLVVESFDGVEIYGTFGSRKVFDIDLSYVDLEKVEFIEGTDEGKVTARVARREFRENPHSRLFKFIGTLIPNTSRQRIDW